MRKTFSILTLSAVLLCAAPAISADRVVVIPLGGAKNYMYWQDDWSAGTIYKIGDAVRLDGSTFMCVIGHTSSYGDSPPDVTYWTLIAEKGDIGANGTQGIQGETGLTGAPGTTGATGPQGLQGDKGDTGTTGSQGIKGETGSPGANGIDLTVSPDGTINLPKNSSEPYVCDADHSGAIALTSRHTTCACNGTTWVLTSNGATTCEWSYAFTCNSEHLGLCATTDTCTAAGGHWWTDGTCNKTIEGSEGCVTVGDGTVVNDGLMWQKSDDGVTRTWAESNDYCSNLTLAGFSDWRLPLKHELMGLVVCSDGTPTPLLDFTSCGTGAAYPTIASCFLSQNSRYYTAAMYENTYSYWCVNFSNGQTHYTTPSYSPSYIYARCVRQP